MANPAARKSDPSSCLFQGTERTPSRQVRLTFSSMVCPQLAKVMHVPAAVRSLRGFPRQFS